MMNKSKIRPSFWVAGILASFLCALFVPSGTVWVPPEASVFEQDAQTPDEAGADGFETPLAEHTPLATPTPTISPAPTPSATPAPTLIPAPDKYKKLEKGDRGTTVAAIQERLALLGFFDGEINGKFTSKLQKSLKAFQTANALEANGVANEKTQRRLFLEGVQVASDGQYYGGVTKAPTGATPAPTPTFVKVTLPMDDFSTGTAPSAENLKGGVYEDPSISVVVTRETISGSVFFLADITVKDPSQLRTALGGTPRASARAKPSKIAARNRAVVAINGDFYPHRNGGFAVRQSQVLSKANSGKFDLLFIDRAGDFHIYKEAKKEAARKEMAEDTYQAFCFGPALIIDGEIQKIDNGYGFGEDYKNPRTAIGQVGPLHYMLLVVDGRTDYSEGVKTKTVAQYLFERGCTQAYNLDGGGSSCMYFGGRVINHMTNGGERSVPDIIYFASTAQNG